MGQSLSVVQGSIGMQRAAPMPAMELCSPRSNPGSPMQPGSRQDSTFHATSPRGQGILGLSQDPWLMSR
jgi:hypothetical protein